MISIGLPAIKPPFLAVAIQSVLDQTFSDFELIVFNDHLDQEIRRIVKSFSDPRIRYFEQGPVFAVVENWNRVLSHARGEYFVLFSDDDRYHPGFLSEMTALLYRYPSCNIVHCRVGKIDIHGGITGYTALCPDYEPGLEFMLNRIKGDREQFAPEFMVRTKMFKDIGGFADLPLAWGSDDLTWFRLAIEGGIAFCPEPLCEWRQSPFQISESGDVGQRLVAVERYTGKLREFVETIMPGNEGEKLALKRIKSMYIDYSDRQKAHLVAVNGRHTSLAQQIAFFMRNRKKHRLKIRWLIYSCYARFIA